MNYIFDLGNVLVNYKPVTYLENLFPDESLVKKLYESIFRSREWLYMDQGLLTFDEATDIFCAREPELRSAILCAMQNVNDIFTPIQETVDLLPAIKESGRGLYYLSNIQVEIRDHLLEKYEFFDLFDGGVSSCDIHMLKPSPEIYRHLISKYRLNPEESLFFDDMQDNVEAAEKEGIKGVVFTTAQCIRPYF